MPKAKTNKNTTEETTTAVVTTETTTQQVTVVSEPTPVSETQVAGIIRQLRENTVEIDANRPWSGWGNLEAVSADIKDIRIGYQQEAGFDVRLGDEVIARADRGIIEALGLHARFPVDFVTKLTPDLQVAIMNDRVSSLPKKDMSVVVRDGAAVNLMPRWRDIVNPAEMAQTAYNAMASLGDTSVMSASFNGESMQVRLITEEATAVTEVEGDALRFGIELIYKPSEIIEVNLYNTRIRCDNQFVSSNQAYGWSQRNIGTADAQMSWVGVGITTALEQRQEIVNRARTMAGTQIQGDPRDALRERVRALGLNRYYNRILEAFEQEPGTTEWAMLNALTRFATHDEELGQSVRNRIQRGSGGWVENFDLVNARLPRQLAMRAGAEILN
jgi:hypothetical protein